MGAQRIQKGRVVSVVSPSPPRGSFQELGRTERLQNFMVNRVQGRKPTPPAVEAQNLNHWTTREFFGFFSIFMKIKKVGGKKVRK